MAKGKTLSALLVTLGLLLAAGAQAQPSEPRCGDPSINHDGNVDLIPLPGQNDCIIAGGITVTNGFLRIRTPNGKIQVGGSISTSSNATSSGNVILTAGGTIEVGGSVTINNASAPSGQSGSVDIKANSASAAVPFVIGSPSSNGIAGSINVDTVNGGGNDPFFIRGGIRIRNRNDITLASMNALSVKATASRSGVIILEATDGTISLPTGTLSADGQSGQSAGAIILMGHAITTQDQTVISASDNVGQANHFVNIAAETISFTGSTGLTIRANGGGSTANGTGSFVYALPEFGIFVTDDSSTNPQSFTWTVTYPFGTAWPGALTWDGAAGAPLTVTANGQSHTQVLMTGYPMTFGAGAGDVLLAARGQEDHKVDLVYTGSTSGINGLVFASNKVTLNANANANSGQGGAIFVSMPKTVSTSPQQVLFTADGPSNASGNGGTIQFFPKGDISLGSNAGQIHLSSQSGNTGGNGGSATISNKPFTTELASSTAVQVTARGADGDGGLIDLSSLFLNFNGTGLRLAADASGVGKGGQLLLDVDGPITVGSGAGAVRLSAEADAVQGSDGGRISITTGSPADITSGQLSVKSGPTGSGGRIELLIGSTLSLTGSLKADAGLQGNGSGGLVSVSTDGELILNGNQSGGGQALSSDGAGTGPGGLVSLSIQGASQPTTIAANQQGALSLSANGGKDATGAFLGAGGTIQLTDLNEGFVITGGALDVKSGPGQNAGSILVDAGTTLAVSGDIRAIGTGNGANGGTIRLTAQSDNDVVFSGTGPTNIVADGGQNGTTGNGGSIVISNSGVGDIVFQNQVVLSAAAEGMNGGTAGTVSASTAGGFVFGGVGSKIKANGKGTTGVNNVQLQSAGDLTFGSAAGEVELVVNGRISGDLGGSVDLQTEGDITVVVGSIVKTTPGPNGNAGSIKAKGQQIIIHGTVDLNGRGSGSGGNLDLEATQNLIFSGVITANSGNNGGNAGVINIHDVGTTSFALGATIRADSTNGQAGKITIAQTGSSQIMALDGAIISASGGAISANNEISVASASAITMGGAQVTADGGGNGFPGKITVSQTGLGVMFLDGATLSASGDPAGDASGHDVTITNTGPDGISLVGTTVNANASSNGDGTGGSVHISSAVLLDLTEAHIFARGADTGAGGVAVVNKADSFSVNEVINVSAGSGVTNIATFAGSITLNSVQCRQWLTGYAWPTAYWNCVNPTDPSAKDEIPAAAGNALHISMPDNNLENVNPIIYVMQDVAQYGTYFNNTLEAHTAAFTFTFGGATRPIYTAVFETVLLNALGSTALRDDWLMETTVHEFGHSVDADHNVESGANTYIDALNADFAQLDAAGGGQPCGTGAPFEGVVDIQTRQQFCTNGVLNNPGGIYTNPQTSQLYSNAEIARVSSQNLNPGTFLGVQGYTEPYAQSFTYRAHANGLSYPAGYYDPTADGLMHNGFFQCAQAVAATRLGQSFTPSYSCN